MIIVPQGDICIFDTRWPGFMQTKGSSQFSSPRCPEAGYGRVPISVAAHIKKKISGELPKDDQGNNDDDDEE